VSRFLARFWSVAIYLFCIVAANWLTARYGFTPVGFGLTATAGTYVAGLAFVARDAVQDAAGRITVLCALAVGAVLSWFASTPQLALASAAAFALSELVDMAVYTPLRKRGYIRAALASNLIGSVVDTLMFLSLAGFGLAPLVVGGQLVGKAWVTLLTVAGVVMIRSATSRRRPARGSVTP
jgi:uncharacterized PurR-regulated membrane protein YhhQ (DUF165 family)